MTFDIVFRYIVMPAMGIAALVFIIRELREYVRDWKEGRL